jgi:poly-gamma-glutamate system protein
MQKRIGKVNPKILIIFALLTIIFFYIEILTIHPVKSSNYENKLKAAQICNEAMKIIKEIRLRKGLPIDLINDPNETGLVGIQFSPITQERTDLSSVLTTTNPNFAAVFVDFLSKFKPYDTIAVGIDGSYPALNLALYSAVRALQLTPIIITTTSSGMWGANLPELTWLDMERALYINNMFPFRSLAATLGGEDDNGRGFSPEAREMLKKAIERNEIKIIQTGDLSSNIHERMALYKNAGRIKCFINIGKSVANLGVVSNYWRTGIIKRSPQKFTEDAVIARMLEAKIPVINITDIHRLAKKYELPIAPVPLPPLGKGKIYIEKRFSVTWAGVFAALIIVMLFFIIKYDIEYYIFKKKPKE